MTRELHFEGSCQQHRSAKHLTITYSKPNVSGRVLASVDVRPLRIALVQGKTISLERCCWSLHTHPRPKLDMTSIASKPVSGTNRLSELLSNTRRKSRDRKLHRSDIGVCPSSQPSCRLCCCLSAVSHACIAADPQQLVSAIRHRLGGVPLTGLAPGDPLVQHAWLQRGLTSKRCCRQLNNAAARNSLLLPFGLLTLQWYAASPLNSMYFFFTAPFCRATVL